ncbi:MAG: hypothetical protein K0R25_1143 [Rickettsiaceae bacterium]|jgi:uncharacterized RDD family membrane protein YckC|nr:hypothetical protein [Rickettsiaceae bacterium]
MSEFQYAGSFKRGFANSIDVLIANLIRVVAVMLLGNLWLGEQIRKFKEDFETKFESDFIGKDPERINFLVQHSVFKSILIFCLLVFASGAVYYILLNASKYRGTIGKKLMKIMIVKNDGEKLTIFESFWHYLLSLIPWIFVAYILAYQMVHSVSIYQAITENMFNLVLGVIALFWLQTNIITKKKATVPDMICKVMVVNKEAS